MEPWAAQQEAGSPASPAGGLPSPCFQLRMGRYCWAGALKEGLEPRMDPKQKVGLSRGLPPSPVAGSPWAGCNTLQFPGGRTVWPQLPCFVVPPLLHLCYRKHFLSASWVDKSKGTSCDPLARPPGREARLLWSDSECARTRPVTWLQDSRIQRPACGVLSPMAELTAQCSASKRLCADGLPSIRAFGRILQRLLEECCSVDTGALGDHWNSSAGRPQ